MIETYLAKPEMLHGSHTTVHACPEIYVHHVPLYGAFFGNYSLSKKNILFPISMLAVRMQGEGRVFLAANIFA